MYDKIVIVCNNWRFHCQLYVQNVRAVLRTTAAASAAIKLHPETGEMTVYELKELHNSLAVHTSMISMSVSIHYSNSV